MSGQVRRLKRRREYLRVAAARSKAVTPGMVVQACGREGDGDDIRVGFTASRKVGKAVARNRARRRLKAVAAELLAAHGRPATDYVLIARGETVTRPFGALRDDLLQALARIDRQPRTHREAQS